jgi:copper chaperone CopZ
MEEIVKKLSLLIVAGAVLFWAFGTVTADDTKDGSIQRAVFKVENLTCGACFSNINEGLTPLAGFSGMGANLFRKLVAVDFIGPLSADEIGAAIINKGYPATLVSVDPIMEKESFAYLNTGQRGSASGGGCCSGGNSDPVASQGQLPQASSGLPGGGSCCVLPPKIN